MFSGSGSWVSVGVSGRRMPVSSRSTRDQILPAVTGGVVLDIAVLEVPFATWISTMTRPSQAGMMWCIRTGVRWSSGLICGGRLDWDLAVEVVTDTVQESHPAACMERV